MPKGLGSVLYFIPFKGKILFFSPNHLRCDLTVGYAIQNFLYNPKSEILWSLACAEQ